MTFVLGVSSGIFAAVPEAERAQYASLFAKAMYCITKGVQFVQIDLESVSEFRSPNLKEDMKKLKEMGVTFGIHSETRAFGVEIAELDSAIETDYKFGHERLREILEESGKINSKYVLIHSSESEPFLIIERHMQPAALVDFFGNSLRKFLEKEENKWLLDWTVEPPKNFIWVEILRRTLEETIKDYVDAQVEHYKRERETITGRPPSEAEVSAYEARIKPEIEERMKKMAKDELLHIIESRTLHYGPERFAYWLIAKWMEKNKDPLWTSIINSTIEYFAKVDGKKVEDWIKDKGIKELSIDDDNFRKLVMLWVPAVSAKYIWGHLNQDKNPGPLKYPDLKPILKKYNMPLVLETPMAHRGMEEWLRLPNPVQMYHLVKAVGPEYLQLAIDLEHMLSIRLDPEKVFDVLPEDAGKFVKVIHAGFPTPLAPAHIPIPFGSDQQVYLYKMYYKLWKKGFGKDKSIEHYLIFERGGGADPIQQSILALRKIVEFLEKDIKPEDLIKYPEFFGISVGEIASMERQLAVVHEHARDPLKGLIVVPEEEYTFLGRAAIEKGKRPEEWKKEELR